MFIPCRKQIFIDGILAQNFLEMGTQHVGEGQTCFLTPLQMASLFKEPSLCPPLVLVDNPTTQTSHNPNAKPILALLNQKNDIDVAQETPVLMFVWSKRGF